MPGIPSIHLLHIGAIPIVNENDTISTYEIQFGDNDTLSAVVAALGTGGSFNSSVRY